MTTISLPEMPPAQTASWLGLFDLADRLSDGWTLVGGQMVQLHCFERGFPPSRTTTDVDAVLDVREHPLALASVTRALADLGFTTDLAMSVEGTNHRWRREEAVIDILIPRHLGPVAAARGDVHGAPGLETTARSSVGSTARPSRSTASPCMRHGSRSPRIPLGTASPAGHDLHADIGGRIDRSLGSRACRHQPARPDGSARLGSDAH